MPLDVWDRSEDVREVLLETAPMPSFDDSLRLLSELTGAPMAAVSLVDHEHQWFRARRGLSMRGVERGHSFCAVAMESDAGLVVTSAQADPRFLASPLVQGEPSVRSYAGVPLEMPDGHRVGALSIFDRRRRSFSEQELLTLRLIAQQVVTQLQLEELLHQQASDIEDLRVARTELRWLALHDDLTGLLNRRGLARALDTLFNRVHPSIRSAWDEGVAALFIDLDDFKEINDEFGHEVGDQVLRGVAGLLASVVGHDKTLGRFGGDEFVVILSGVDAPAVEALVTRLVAALDEPLVIGDLLVPVRASIGIAAAERGGGAAELLDLADRAMYVAKHDGGRHTTTWSRTPDPDEVRRRRRIGEFVQQTISNDRIEVAFQPMFDLTTGTLLRREALLRWVGSPPPGLDVETFIRTAEQHGLISDVGRQVLRHACQSAAEWQRMDPGCGVSVNVSALEVMPALVDTVSAELRTADLDPRLLTIEVTESTVLEQTPAVHQTLAALHALGVRVALDDFGTGYASMAILCDLPFDEVKIDRRFCSDVEASTIAVAEATIELGHSLGLTVVAEGIEDDPMLSHLRGLGCDIGQGFLLGRPERYATV